MATLIHKVWPPWILKQIEHHVSDGKINEPGTLFPAQTVGAGRLRQDANLSLC